LLISQGAMIILAASAVLQSSIDKHQLLKAE